MLCTLALALAAPAAQDPAPTHDAAAIRWVLPDAFDEALRRAHVEERLVLVKGVSFGIDDAGARCATKGKW
jgi:hypothetical protein